MRIVFGLVLVAGLALAWFAVQQVQSYINAYKVALIEERKISAQVVPTLMVAIANREIGYGSEVTEGDVRYIRWPETSLPVGAFIEGDGMLFSPDGQYRKALRKIYPNEPVLDAFVSPVGGDAGLISRLAPGSRAFTISVSATSAVSGFIKPGDLVDIYWSGNIARASGSGYEDQTMLIMSNVQIVAVDQTADVDVKLVKVPKTVTVEVTPEQVAILTQANKSGDLTLSLIGLSDDTVAKDISVNENSFIGRSEATPDAPAALPQQKCYVNERRGAETLVIEIPCTR